MLAPRPINRTKVLILTLVLAAAVGGLAYLVLQNLLAVGSADVPADVQQNIAKVSAQRFPPVPRVNPNPPLFASPQFTRLKLFTELPVRPGVTGRPNPFKPVPYGAPAVLEGSGAELPTPAGGVPRPADDIQEGSVWP